VELVYHSAASLTRTQTLVGAGHVAWLRHMKGLADVFVLRGPRKSISEMEKQILLASMGGLVSYQFL
jgi:hypothetical protein